MRISFNNAVRVFTRFSVFILFFTSACSSMLYAPTKEIVAEPSYFGLEHQNFDINVADHTIKLWRIFGKRKTQGSENQPLVLVFHGNAQNMSTHFQSMIWLAQMGYDYFIFDYAGYGKSDGTPSPHETVLDGIAVLRKVYELAPHNPIVVIGQSLGGAIAARTLIENKKNPKLQVPVSLLVLDSTFHSYQSVGRRVLAKHWITWPFQWMSYLVLSDQWAPGSELENLSPMPVIVMHAQNDQVVPYAAGQSLFAHIKEPKEFWSIEQGAHIQSFWVENFKYRNMFLEKLEHISQSQN